MPYTLEKGAIVGPSGLPLVCLVQARYGDGALSTTERDAFRRQILQGLNAAEAARAVLAAWDAPHFGDLDDARESMCAPIEALRLALTAEA